MAAKKTKAHPKPIKKQNDRQKGISKVGEEHILRMLCNAITFSAYIAVQVVLDL